MARWLVRDDHPDCDGFAVVAEADPDTIVPDGCYDSREAALERVVELLDADEGDEDEPVETDGEPAPGASVAWRGVLAMANTRTEDGRVYTQLGVRDGNLPLAVQDDAQHAGGFGGGPGGTVGGTIERTLQVGNAILGWGTYHGDENGQRAAQLTADQGRFGVSVDLADLDQDVAYECRATGMVEDPWYDGEVEACVDMLVVFPFARIAGATMTPIPAFGQAWVELVSASELDDDAWAEQVAAEAEASAVAVEAERVERIEGRGHQVIVASAVPALPPAEWFATPEAAAPQPLTWTADGRVSGHLALWDECHIGMPGCVSPSRSATGYALFHTGAVRVMTPDGPGSLRAGQLTFRTTHADERLNLRQAVAHYEHTGQVCADLVVTDGELGVWCSGALRSGFTDDDVREILGAAPSGDWRWDGGNLELVSVLQVNTPGFMGPHRATARAVTAGGGHTTTLLRLGHGYPHRPAADHAAAIAALRHELAELRARVDPMWEAGGRNAVLDSLSLSGPRPPAVPAAAATSSGKGPCGSKTAKAACGCKT